MNDELWNSICFLLNVICSDPYVEYIDVIKVL